MNHGSAKRSTHAEQDLAAIGTMLSPRSVAVIGASERPGSMPAAPVRNLIEHGYEGSIYPVNPNRSSVYGIPAVAHVSQLSDVPETAIIVVPGDHVSGTIRDLGELGVPSATIVSAGFQEAAAGAAGESRAQELAKAVEESGVRVLGPNTTGVVNLLDRYVPRAARNHPSNLRPGSLAVIGQSGALGNGLFNRILRHGLGIGYLVATGNQMDVDIWDVVRWVAEDDRISAIMLLVESLPDAGKLAGVASQTRTAGKPLVALVLGMSQRGREVVATHSGSLAGTSEVVSSVLREEGIVQVHELDELWEVAQLFEAWGVPEAAVHGLAVISTSGGDAALGADTAEQHEVDLPPPTSSTIARLLDVFSFAEISNPFDLTAEFMGRHGLITESISAMLGDGSTGAVLFSSLVTAGHYATSMYAEVGGALDQRQGGRFAVAARTGPEGDPESLVRLRADYGVPTFEGIERAVRAISHYMRYARLIESALETAPPEPAATVEDSGPAPSTPSNYWLDRITLADLGVPFNRAELVRTPDEAVSAAERVGLPVVAKLSLPGSGHKFASGGVRLLLANDHDVRDAAEQLLGQLPDPSDVHDGVGLVIERQEAGVAELLLGLHRDEVFGPVVLVGLGGTWTEAYRDLASFRWPAGHRRIEDAIQSTTIGRSLLSRGVEATEGLVEMIGRVGPWFAASTWVRAVDINPVLVRADGAIVAVDARLEVERPRPP